MAVFERVLVAIDDRSDAAALAGAVAAVTRSESEITALNVRMSTGEGETPLAVTAFRRGLGTGHQVSPVHLAGRHQSVADDIVDFADRMAPDLVVIGSRGLSDLRALLTGSVTHRVLAAVACPVLVVRAGVQATPLRRLLLAFDASHPAGRAAEMAALLAHEAGAEIEVFYVSQAIPDASGYMAGLVEPIREELDALAGRLRRSVPTTWAVEPAGSGRAAGIVAEAEALPAELIVMGSRGLSRIAGAVIGSVSHEVIHLTRRPVLLVP